MKNGLAVIFVIICFSSACHALNPSPEVGSFTTRTEAGTSDAEASIDKDVLAQNSGSEGTNVSSENGVVSHSVADRLMN